MSKELEDLEKLGELKEKGLITEEEFQKRKEMLLNANSKGEDKTSEWDKKQFWRWMGLGIFIPVVGWVVGLVNVFKGGRKTRQALLILLVSIVTAVIYYTAFGGFSSGDTEIVSIVKEGTLQAYPEKSFGEAVDGFFANPKWEHLVAEDGNDYVNVSGKITYQEKPVKAVLQFKVDKETGTFEINAFEINRVPQTVIIYMELIEKMFE